MANLKYNEETKIVTFRVPESKVKIFRGIVNEILESYIEQKDYKEIYPTEKKCECYLDSNGFLRRGKIKCTKSKKEHKF